MSKAMYLLISMAAAVMVGTCGDPALDEASTEGELHPPPAKDRASVEEVNASSTDAAREVSVL